MKKKGKESNGDKYLEIRTGLTPEALSQAFLDNLFYTQGRTPDLATRNDLYMALAYTVRDRMLARWLSGIHRYREHTRKDNLRAVCYLSAEFLPGPHLGNNLINLGIYEEARQAMEILGIKLEELIAQEEEPGLGNGGLGRLASCFMDSMATLQVPALGYGIRYDFGIFDQVMRDGWQVEITDKWLRLGNPWEIQRPELSREVQLGGRTEQYRDEQGQLSGAMASRHGGQGDSLRHPDPGLPGQYLQQSSSVESGSGGVLRFPGFQPGKLLCRG